PSPARWFFQTVPALLQPITLKKGAEPHPSLGNRREAEYPAYPQFPTKILRQMLKVQEIMVKRLPALEVPVLMIESPNDYFIHKDETQLIFDSLSEEGKELIWLEDYDHNMLYRSDRQEILQLISDFLAKVS
ncbi:MAG: alpha/beta hydrolase, partial [Anaerolineales bacterium]